ncbi:MAG: hypothetical protein KAU26_05210 [Methylococcales bacterium]|nr:hypothetical protein [Methylococcales bacterium]
MPYTDFNLAQVKKKFELIEERTALFPQIKPIVISDYLTEALDIGLELALATASEKARSEFIIAPILFELERHYRKKLAIYSGERLDVDKAQGLTGECDFILSKGMMTHTIQAPIFALVEAKKNDISQGLGQCVAQMVAAMLYNQTNNKAISILYGCVTTGETWQFLRLQGNQLHIDSQRHYINEIGIILAILQQIVKSVDELKT